MNYTKSLQEAAEIAINAGTDMDLNQGRNVLDVYTIQNVNEGKVKEQTVREAVRRGYIYFHNDNDIIFFFYRFFIIIIIIIIIIINIFLLVIFQK